MLPFHRILAASMTCLLAFGAEAAAQDRKDKKLQRSAVGSQEIQLEYMFNLDPGCKSYGEIRFVVLAPPKNGAVTFKPVEMFPSFKQDNPRHACNKNKVMAQAAFYAAREGFKGTDKFRFAIVFHDGEAWTYDVDMTVWGPGL